MLLADLTEINELEKLKPLLENYTQNQINDICAHYRAMLPDLEEHYLRADYYFHKGRIDISWFQEAAEPYFNIKEIVEFLSESYPNKKS
jgi:hypothetical protein